jgi:hypothetical protein
MATDKIKAGVEFSLFGFFKVTLEGEFSGKERETAARVLRRLADHAALYRTLELEYAGKVVTSIERMRQWLGDELQSLPARSGVATPLLGLQSACREFLATVDHLNEGIATSYEGAKATRDGGYKLYGDQERLVALVERRGTPKLLRSEETNLTEIEPPFTQWSFVAALERLRVKAGPAVVGLGRIAGDQAVPDDLRAMSRGETSDV